MKNIVKLLKITHRNSGFTHEKWWCSICFCMFTEGIFHYPMIFPWYSHDISRILIFRNLVSKNPSNSKPVPSAAGRGLDLQHRHGGLLEAKPLGRGAVFCFAKTETDSWIGQAHFLWRMMGFYTVCFFWIYDELVWFHMILWDVAVISIIEFNEVFSGDYSWGVHSMV
jgi:hypothetical protein